MKDWQFLQIVGILIMILGKGQPGFLAFPCFVFSIFLLVISLIRLHYDE